MIEGRKDDGGKLRFDLVPPDALAELVRVYTHGASRYGSRSWETGIKYGRIYAALLRHCIAFWGGEEKDPDDGLHHMAHAAWNCLTLLAYEQRGMVAYDDRPSTDQNAEPPIFTTQRVAEVVDKFADNNAEVMGDMRHGERRA